MAKCPPTRRGSTRRPRPIRDDADAVWLFGLAVSRPLQPETLCVHLDDAGRGGTVVIVSGTTDPDTLFTVLELMAQAAEQSDRTRLVVASVRPGGGLLIDDCDRWMEASDLVARHGARLVEWFVISEHGFTTPRDLLGEPGRWGQ